MAAGKAGHVHKDCAYAVTLFVVVFLCIQSVVFMYYKNSFTVDNDRFIQAGVMEYNDNGKKLYIPVFRRK